MHPITPYVNERQTIERLTNRRPKEARMFDERPSTGTVTTWYVERRVAVSEHDVTRALGEALRADEVEPETGAPIDAVRHGRPGAARGFTSRLRVGRLRRPIGVEVEVEPWSPGVAVLGVRPERRPSERVARSLLRGGRRAARRRRALHRRAARRPDTHRGPARVLTRRAEPVP